MNQMRVPFPERINEKYCTQEDLLQSVPEAFLALGAIYAILQLTAGVFLVNPIPTVPQHNEPEKVENEASNNHKMMSLNEISQNMSN